MPGELQDENTSQNVGRYEAKYPATDEWMKSRVESVPTASENDKTREQAKRVLKSMIKKAYKST